MDDTLNVIMTVYLSVLAGQPCNADTIFDAIDEKHAARGTWSDAFTVIYYHGNKRSYDQQKLERLINWFEQ